MNWRRFGQKFALYLPLTIATTLVLRVFLQLDGDFSRWREAFAVPSILLTIFITGWITWSIIKHDTMYSEDQ